MVGLALVTIEEAAQRTIRAHCQRSILSLKESDGRVVARVRPVVSEDVASALFGGG